jgi:peptidoglycan hydrolase CwlO-like protein
MSQTQTAGRRMGLISVQTVKGLERDKLAHELQQEKAAYQTVVKEKAKLQHQFDALKEQVPILKRVACDSTKAYELSQRSLESLSADLKASEVILEQRSSCSFLTLYLCPPPPPPHLPLLSSSS